MQLKGNQAMRWTPENTEGFTDAELATLNEAQACLALDLAHLGGDEEFHQAIADALNNCWHDGANVAVLVAMVKARLGA
jgi:DNA-binding FadR family transcriptional regulator